MEPSARPKHLSRLLLAVLALIALADLIPLGYMAALGARDGTGEAGAGDPVWFGPWLRLFRSSPHFLRWFLNSTAVTVISVSFHLIADAMAAYVLAKWTFRGKRAVFALIIAAMMVPRQVTMIPLFLGMSRWGLADTFAGLLLPGLGDVVGVFLLRQFMLTIPDALLEAAVVDGASRWATFRHIVLPLSLPAMAVMGVLAFQRYWSDFFWPVVITHSEEHYTLQVGLSYLVQSDFGADYSLLAAGACATAVPALVIFMLFRRLFFEGYRGGAVK